VLLANVRVAMEVAVPTGFFRTKAFSDINPYLGPNISQTLARRSFDGQTETRRDSTSPAGQEEAD
jgi:hypothetical protein